jgi:hypothetical protein
MRVLRKALRGCLPRFAFAALQPFGAVPARDPAALGLIPHRRLLGCQQQRRQKIISIKRLLQNGNCFDERCRERRKTGDHDDTDSKIVEPLDQSIC